MRTNTIPDKTRPGMNKTRRRREFEDQLREADWTKHVSQGETEGVCRAYTGSEHSETYLVWMHYSDEFNWWGIAKDKRNQLNSTNAQLLHAFLGRQRGEWYLLPDEKVENLNLGRQSRGTVHYKVQIDHRDSPNPPNRELLERYAIDRGTQS